MGQEVGRPRKEADVVVIGDKGRSQMRRSIGDNITRSATDVVSPGNYTLASALSTEFIVSTQLYHSFMDGAAAEQSSRMTAMENASQNAGEMIDSLTLQYNRARQSRITTELIEIISGASAIEDE